MVIKKKKPPLSGCGSCLGGLRRAEHLENDLTWTRDKWPDSFHRRSRADVAGMKGSRRPRGRRFLPREHISLNSLVEIGPPDGILCISPTRHSILLLPAVLPSVTAIMGRVINIWSPSLKFSSFFFYPALWMHISIKQVVGGGRCARVKIHAGPWRLRLDACCARMVDVFLRFNYGWHTRVRIARCVNLRTQKCRRCNVVTASKWSFYDLIISDSNTMLISFF